MITLGIVMLIVLAVVCAYSRYVSVEEHNEALQKIADETGRGIIEYNGRLYFIDDEED